MATRAIRLYGDPVLRAPAAPVTRFDARLRALVADLTDTMLGAPGRAALAAPQIGVSRRVFVFDAGGRRGHLVNPTLRDVSGVQDGDEACLSLPGMAFPTPRAAAVTVDGFDQHGAPATITATGFLARALQHETDHLDGVLFVDALRGDARRRALRELRAARRQR